MPYLPEPISTDDPVSSIRSARALRRAEIEVFEHGVRAAALLAKEEADAFCSAEATRFSLSEELSLLEYGRARAGNDPVAQALVSRKLAAFVDRNDRRLTRRYS